MKANMAAVRIISFTMRLPAYPDHQVTPVTLLHAGAAKPLNNWLRREAAMRDKAEADSTIPLI
jgi:hypothetical protein